MLFCNNTIKIMFECFLYLIHVYDIIIIIIII